MATTKIWAVTDRLDQVVNYIENEEKTIDKAYDALKPKISAPIISNFLFLLFII